MRKTKTNKWIKVGLGAMAGAISLQAQAAILNVCPSGCTYSLPSTAVNVAAAGDTIQIQAGTYTDCLNVNKNNLTIVGVNGMAKLVNRVCLQKGIIVTAAQNAIIRNIELSGATNNDNYAGIRHDAAGFNVTLDNVYIHDNDNGILSSAIGDTVTIQNSRFENNGQNLGSGLAHNMYIGESAVFNFINSVSNSAKLYGHELKSRAAKTYVSGSTLASLGGKDSRNMDISNGGQLIIENSVIEKGANSDNGDMIAFGPEGLRAGRTNTVTATGNIFIGDKLNTTAFSYLNNASSVSITGNTYVAVNGMPAGNTYYASRSAAGYQAYPWLPTPGRAPASTPTPTPTPSTPTPTPTPTSSAWTFCANEAGTCSFSGTRTVRYGAGSTYATRTATGSIGCDNATFGDPIPGTVKHCDYSSTASATPTPTPTPTPAPPPTSTAWTFCANEGGTCSFSGTATVRYGAGSTYATRIATGSIGCNNATFGDPAPGIVKHCDYQVTSSSTPAPTPTTTTTGAFRLKTRVNTAYCADSPSPTNGTQLHMWQCVDTTNQRMEFTAAGEIRINGKCVDGASLNDGERVIMWDCHGGANQKWSYSSTTGEVKASNGRCLDIYGGSAFNDAKLHIFNCHGGANQKWDRPAY